MYILVFICFSMILNPFYDIPSLGSSIPSAKDLRTFRWWLTVWTMEQDCHGVNSDFTLISPFFKMGLMMVISLLGLLWWLNKF